MSRRKGPPAVRGGYFTLLYCSERGGRGGLGTHVKTTYSRRLGRLRCRTTRSGTTGGPKYGEGRYFDTLIHGYMGTLYR